MSSSKVFLKLFGGHVAKVKAAKRKFVDWDSIEPLYRSGAMSNYEICGQYEIDHANSQVWKKTVAESAIRKQSRTKNWKKTLAEKVKKQIKENLVRSEVRSANQNLSDTEIVEKAAEVGSNIVLRHRKEIAALMVQEGNLLKALGIDIDKDTLKDRTIILKNITDIRSKRIALERQAHSLNDSSSAEQSFEDWLNES